MQALDVDAPENCSSEKKMKCMEQSEQIGDVAKDLCTGNSDFKLIKREYSGHFEARESQKLKPRSSVLPPSHT